MEKLAKLHGIQYQRSYCFENWQAHFTQMPRAARNIKYLLVFAYTFSTWFEAYPTRTKKTSEEAWDLLKCVIPDLGYLISYSDNGQAFVS